jgi:hypothetical protein
MQPPSGSLQEGIARQRESLKGMLAEPLTRIATTCSTLWDDRPALEAALRDAFSLLPGSKFIYALGTDAVQICGTLTREGIIEADYHRDRSSRPYMCERLPYDGFLLSRAYISLRAHRPSLTAIQLVRGSDWRVLGFIGADFDLRDLPITREIYDEPRQWRQIKGDPAIRGTVFHQTRSESLMDANIDIVLSVVEELITEHGVFHVKLHFSSSRAVIWLMQDPYRYRLLDFDSLTDPDICLTYPVRAYPTDATVHREQIRLILDNFRALRFMDEMFYLRTCTLNIFNGIVGLTFSCDGSHYVPADEFISKGFDFWTGGVLLA